MSDKPKYECSCGEQFWTDKTADAHLYECPNHVLTYIDFPRGLN